MVSNASAAAVPSEQAQTGKKQASKQKIQFTDLNDLFLQDKGKKLRNLQKKWDKLVEQEKKIKKGELTPNDDLKAKLDKKGELKAEIKELKDLCDLYIKSNPDYDKKNKAPELTQEDIQKAVAESLRQVSQVLTLSALVKDDASLVEASE